MYVKKIRFASVFVSFLWIFTSCCIFTGCHEDLLQRDYTKMDAVEKAKYITELQKKFEEGFAKAMALPKDAKLEERISILEKEALPYCRRAHEVARGAAHAPLRGFANVTAVLGGYYRLLAEQIKERSPKDPQAQKLAKQYEMKAREYMKEAADLLLLYERLWQYRRPWPDLYPIMVLNYHNMEDYRSAYLLSLKRLAELKKQAKRNPADPELDKAIRAWKKTALGIRKKMIERLEPVPEDPYGVID